MANQIILKRSSTPGKVPTTAQLALGEIGINTYDGLIYIKKNDGSDSVVQIGGVTSVNTKTGSVVLSTTDVAEGTAQYFTNARARAAISAGTGISYNSSTGAITTAQNLSTAGTPQFAGMTLTGGISSIAGSIVPSADVTYDLGSPSKQWKDIYVGPGSLYVNGQKVLQDDAGTITFSADLDENIRIKTLGTGILQLGSSTSNIQIDGTLQIAAGKNITDSAGIKVNFGDNIEMNSNKIIGLGAPSSANDAATKTYVDTAIGNISTSTLTQGNSNISVVDSGTGTVTVTVDGSTALTVDANGVVVAGNFTVSGTTTSVNSNTINLADNIITLNSDATGAPSQNAGIEVKRGDEANVQLRWNEGSDIWTFTNNGAVYYPMAVSTTDLAEGTNQYFTDARARSALNITNSTGISYNSSTGTFGLGSIPNSSLSNNSITINGTSVALGGTRTLDTDVVSEGVTNKYFSNTLARGAVSAGGSLSYNSSTGVFSYTTPSTTGITEGTNLYYTDARARAAITAGTGITVTSGVVATTITQYTDALARGAVSFAAGSGAYNSTTGVFTIPTNTNQLTNGASFATTSYVDSAVQAKDNTDEITEGSTNRFFTDARARAAVSAGTGISYNSTTGVITNTITQYTDALARGAVSVTDSGGDGSLSYNSTTGVITYTGPSASDVRAHFSAGTGITITSGAIATTITQYTDALARGAVSFAAGSGAYNSSTGVFSIPTNTNQLTNGAGYITGITSGNVTTALGFTPYNSTNPSGYITGITSGNVTTALGFTPYNSTNPSGYVTSSILASTHTGALSTSSACSTGGLTVSGNLTATGEITAYYSDARLKTNVSKIDSALEKVMAINGYTYDSSELAQSLGLPKHMDQIGLMADEVEAVLPELVTQSAIEGYKTIRYDKVVSVLVNAIKEQQAMIEELRKDMKKTLH